MLTTGLIHPGILRALAGAGHGARILIADANYPHSTGIGQRAEFAAVLGLPLSTLGRTEFYAAARSDDVALAIATGEQRLYGNLLLTVGAWTG